jgi:Tfp pilus assembly protein PilW
MSATARSATAVRATTRIRATRLARDQTGISLVELIVAIALTAVIATLMVTIVVTVSRSFTREAQSSTNSDSASVGMRELSRVIRSAAEVSLAGLPAGTAPAEAIISAGAQQITLYSFVDVDVAVPTPVTAQFVVGTDGALTEIRWAASAAAVAGGTSAPNLSTTLWQFAAAPTPPRIVLRGVVSTAAEPIFRYYTAAGVELVVPASGALDASQLPAIAAVKVTLRVQQFPAGTGTAAVLENTIGLPNLGVSRVRSAP